MQANQGQSQADCNFAPKETNTSKSRQKRNWWLHLFFLFSSALHLFCSVISKTHSNPNFTCNAMVRHKNENLQELLITKGLKISPPLTYCLIVSCRETDLSHLTHISCNHTDKGRRVSHRWHELEKKDADTNDRINIHHFECGSRVLGQKMADLICCSLILPFVFLCPFILCSCGKSEGDRWGCVRKMSSSHNRCLCVGSGRFPSCVSCACLFLCVWETEWWSHATHVKHEEEQVARLFLWTQM